VSGSGSTKEATAHLRSELVRIIKDRNISSILDLPCGDKNWIKQLFTFFDYFGVKYTGADIVEELNPDIVLDITNDALPAADLLICRDCLVHLSYTDIIKALANIRISPIKYLLVTTFPKHRNTDIQTGQWRPINMALSPINMAEYLDIIDEWCLEPGFDDKSMVLYRINQ
jgi:hypothetical protein